MSLLDLIAHSYDELGAARAGAAERIGQIWGNAADTLSQVPQQVQQAQQRQVETQTAQIQNQVAQTQLQGLQAAAASQARARAAVSTIPRNPDGTLDTGAIEDALTAAGTDPQTQAEYLKNVGTVNDSIQSFQQARLQHAAKIAQAMRGNLAPGAPATWDAVNAGLAIGQTSGLVNDQDMARFAALQAAGADPDAILKDDLAAVAPPPKYEGLPANSPGAINTSTGAVTPTGIGAKPRTPTELEVDAATLGTPQETPTAALSAAAIKAAAANKAPTPEQDTQRAIGIRARMAAGAPIDPVDANWLTAYDQNREDPAAQAAAAAASRAAAATTATNARLATTESFQEAQAGRTELNKAEDTLGKAQAQAQTFRDVVASAQAGNKYAASQQALEGALSTIRSAGLSRINQTEIGASQGAGDLWDRIQGWLGKADAGQPVPPDIQQAMLQYANVLEQGAYSQYSDKFDQTVKRYPLPNEQKLPAPVAAGAPAQTRTATINGQKVTFTKGPSGWTAPGIAGVYDDTGKLIPPTGKGGGS